MKILAFLSLLIPCFLGAQPIDRRQVVSRHDIVISKTLPTSPAQVGNGHFAFGADISGLQSFVPFNTLSDWGWHNSPLPEGKTPEDYTPTVITSYGRNIKYLLEDESELELTRWLKSNPHRANLGRVGLILLKQDGTPAQEDDLECVNQESELWTGRIISDFSLEGRNVRVITVCHPDEDLVAVHINSSLLSEGRISIFFDFPYWDGKEFSKLIGDYSCAGSNLTRYISQSRNGVCHPAWKLSTNGRTLFLLPQTT